jgi:CheY-like chemotaxis protein
VESAISGHQALAIFQPGKYDLVIVDFFMPAMTGDRLAAQIKILDPRQPVVMATAYLERLKTTAQHSTSIDLLIGKPFEMQSLREAISQLTAG